MISKQLRVALATVVAGAFVTGGVTAEAQIGKNKKKVGDKRVAAALDKAELKYEVTDSGDFKLLYEVDDRTQVVIVESAGETLGDLEIREVWAIAMKSNGAFDAETANAFLIDNGRRKLGAWQIAVDGDGTHSALFSAQVDGDADSETLEEAILAVVRTADAMEKELTGEDEF